MTVAVEADFETIVAAMRDDFIADARDKIDQVDDILDALEAGTGRYEHQLLEIQRLIHSIKGTAGSFGFMSISRIAHALEDFVEIVNEQGKLPVLECRNFLFAMEQILSTRAEPSEKDTVRLLDCLPVPRNQNAALPDKMVGKAALLMPKGLQRKIMAQEMASLGFRVIIADQALELLDVSLSDLPDVVVTTMMPERMSGADLARVFGAIERTRHIRVAILTSGEPDDQIGELPPQTAVIRKGPTMAPEFIAWLEELEII